jgi:hypothetical protein
MPLIVTQGGYQDDNQHDHTSITALHTRRRHRTTHHAAAGAIPLGATPIAAAAILSTWQQIPRPGSMRGTARKFDSALFSSSQFIC